MKKIAFILAGCGGTDGTEIHEATYSYLAAKQLGCDYECFSIDKPQKIVKNNYTQEVVDEKRNLLVESARLGKFGIKDIKELKVDNFDILFFPGGFGSAINISTFAIDGENYTVDENVAKIINEFKNKGKVICAVCIAPMILAKTLHNVKITLGKDEEIATIVSKNGNHFIPTESGNICVDEENKVITSPCFMLTKNPAIVYEEVYSIIEKAIEL